MSYLKIFYRIRSRKYCYIYFRRIRAFDNSKIGEIVEAGSNLGFKVPLITNAHSLTENNLKRQKGLMKLDSLRVSLYGVDEKSYEFLTTIKKSYAIVKRNCINFLKYRNEMNPKLKFGFNYIIIRENIKDLPKLLNLLMKLIQVLLTGLVSIFYL